MNDKDIARMKVLEERKLTETIEDYLKKCVELRNKIGRNPKGYNYVSQEDYVLDKGRQYFERKLTKDEKKIIWKLKREACIDEGRCFENCLRIAIEDKSGLVRYVEGFACAVIPVHHAWLVINDAVVDVTWDLKHMKPLTPDREYYGVEFPDKKRLKLKLWDSQLSFLDDWPNKWPLLKEKRSSRSSTG